MRKHKQSRRGENKIRGRDRGHASSRHRAKSAWVSNEPGVNAKINSTKKLRQLCASDYQYDYGEQPRDAAQNWYC